MAKLWQFLQGHPKPAFSEKVQRGDQKKFFKNRQKRCARLKGPIALSCARHYPIFSIHLKCKDWRRFWRKQLLQNFPSSQVMAIFAGSPKKAFPEKVQKGNKGNFSKIAQKVALV